jgi:hypothetical protein
MALAYLDSCVVIYYVERHAGLATRVEARLFRAGIGAPQIAYSDLTRLECRVLPLRWGDKELLARYDTFFGLPECRYVALNRDTFDLAAELRARYAIKPTRSDCRLHCQSFTTDRRTSPRPIRTPSGSYLIWNRLVGRPHRSSEHARSFPVH